MLAAAAGYRLLASDGRQIGALDQSATGGTPIIRKAAASSVSRRASDPSRRHVHGSIPHGCG
jgi:hypothetical protein